MSDKVRNLIYKISVDSESGDVKVTNQRLEKLKKDLDNAEKGTLEYEQALKRLNNAQRQVAKDIDNSSKSVNNFATTMRKARNVLTGFVGVASAGIIGRDAIGRIRQFEQSLADLGAITGATAGDLQFYAEEARAVGKTTTVSASEAVEAFKLIGSAKPELLANRDALVEVTKQAVILAEASGLELPVAAQQLGSALNALNLPASEAGTVIDTLALAAQKGTQEIPFVTDALSKFGGVAASAGDDIQTSVAAIEILGKKIPDAATAGTNLRNIFLILQTAAAEQGREFRGLSEELELLSPRLNDVTFLQETFGRENILAAQTLIEQRGALAGLRDELNEQGAAQAQAEQRTQTLNGAIARLGNAYEDYILQASEGTGALTEAIDWLARNLEDILNFAIRVGRAFLTYKAAVLTTNAAIRAAAIANKVYRLSVVAMNRGLKTSINLVGGLGKALSGNVLALGFTLISELTDGFGLFSSEAEDATEQANEFTRAQEIMNEVTQRAEQNILEETAKLRNLFDQLKNTNPESERRAELIERINKEYGTTLKNISDETEFVNQLDRAYAGLVNSIKQKILLQANEDKLNELIKEQIKLEEELVAARAVVGVGDIAEQNAVQQRQLTVEELRQLGLSSQEEFEQFNRNLQQGARGNVSALEGELAAVNEAIDGLQNNFERLGAIGGDTPSVDGEGGTPQNRATTQAARERALTFLDRLEERLKRNLMAREELVTLQTPEDDPYLKALKSEAIELEIQIEQVKKLIEAKRTSNEVDQTKIDLLQAEIDKFEELNRAGEVVEFRPDDGTDPLGSVRRTGRVDEAQIERNFQLATIAIRQKALDEEQAKIVQYYRDRGELEEGAQERLKEIEKERVELINQRKKIEFEKGIETLLKEEEDLRTEFLNKVIDGEFQTNEEIVEAEQELQSRLRELKIEALEEQLFLLDEESLAYKELTNQILELQRKQTEGEKEEAENRKEVRKKEFLQILDGFNQVSDEVFNLLDQRTQNQIDAIDQVISAQEGQIAKTREIADKGNAELLELEEERLAKLQEERAKFVRKQQALAAIELVANSAVAIAKAAAEGGAAAPFTIAATLIALTAGLAQARALASQAAFYKGGLFSDEGGYTGAMGIHSASSRLGRKPYEYHGQEFIFNNQKTTAFRDIFEAIHNDRLNPRQMMEENSLMKSMLANSAMRASYQDHLKPSIRLNTNSGGGITKDEMHDLLRRNKQNVQLKIDRNGLYLGVNDNMLKQRRIKRRL